MYRQSIQFPIKDEALREDVHALGTLIGETLRDQGGEDFFKLVEGDRLPAQRRQTIPFHELEEVLASLIAQRLADQGAKRVHVLAQRLVLDRKLNALAIHNARLVGKHGEIL